MGPDFGQVEPGSDGPSEGALGVVAMDADLTVGDLAQGARILPSHSHRAMTLLGEAGVVEDQDAVPLGGQLGEPLDALAVEILVVPGHLSEQSLESLFGGAGDDLREGVAVLDGMLGKQPREVAFQGLSRLTAHELNTEGREKLGQFG